MTIMYDFTLKIEGVEIDTVRAADANTALQMIKDKKGKSMRGLRPSPNAKAKTPMEYTFDQVEARDDV